MKLSAQGFEANRREMLSTLPLGQGLEQQFWCAPLSAEKQVAAVLPMRGSCTMTIL